MNKVIIATTIMFVLCSCSLKKKKNQNQVNSSESNEISSPLLTKPKVKKIWVPEKIEGDKFIEGHWMWVLERTTSWSL